MESPLPTSDTEGVVIINLSHICILSKEISKQTIARVKTFPVPGFQRHLGVLACFAYLIASGL